MWPRRDLATNAAVRTARVVCRTSRQAGCSQTPNHARAQAGFLLTPLIAGSRLRAIVSSSCQMCCNVGRFVLLSFGPSLTQRQNQNQQQWLTCQHCCHGQVRHLYQRLVAAKQRRRTAAHTASEQWRRGRRFRREYLSIECILLGVLLWLSLASCLQPVACNMRACRRATVRGDLGAS